MATVLIDADGLVYRFAHKHHEQIDWGDDTPTDHHNIESARQAVDDSVDWLKERTNCKKAVMCLSDPEYNWRKDIYPEYKANRDDDERPQMWSDLRRYITENYNTYERPGLEADDVLGILQTSKKIVLGKTVVASVDKDLTQVPGWYFNPQDPDTGVVKIKPRNADYQFYSQILTGDKVDNYPGLPGVGERFAEQFLSPFHLLYPDYVWDLIVLAYHTRGYTEDDALTQAQVARICRVEDYDFTEKEVKLWMPNTD